MRPIRIQAPVPLTTKNEINVMIYVLFLITAMRPIWRLSDDLTTKNETLIIQGTWQEFHITAMRPIWIGPDLPHNKK